MNATLWRTGVGAVVAAAMGISNAFAALNAEQIALIRETAQTVCKSVEAARGKKTDLQIEGDVRAELSGLVKKLANVGASGRGKFTEEDFEGISRDATATAMENDRNCRERIFNKMFDKLM